MITDRQKIFNTVSRTWAITRYDIEHHQEINDLSLNIHGENYFRDLFNELYDLKLENTNFKSKNSACIDLLDNKNKIAIQITTTRTKEKINNSLQVLTQKKYDGYKFEIFYLLNKAKPNKDTVDEIKKLYSINLNETLKDYTNIICDINNLEHSKLIHICKKFFEKQSEKYTDNISLNLVIQHLLRNIKNNSSDYNDCFGTVEVNKKIKLNRLNNRISSQLKLGLDYQSLVENLEEESTLTDLRKLVVNDFFAKILINKLKNIVKGVDKNSTVESLQTLAAKHNLDFNELISKLHDKVQAEIGFVDFNSMNISWIIIGFFFEICDVGIHKK